MTMPIPVLATAPSSQSPTSLSWVSTSASAVPMLVDAVVQKPWTGSPTTGHSAISGGGGGDDLSGGRGRDTIMGGGGRDSIEGGGGRDELSGNGGRDLLLGGGGADLILGGGGRDSLFGGGGRDTLDGGGGRDVLNGDGGRDLIIGGRGADVLTGGGGADVFSFTQGSGRDRITDYNDVRDRIMIERGADEFSDLLITQAGDNAMIRFANVRIILEDTDSDLLDAGDFIF